MEKWQRGRMHTPAKGAGPNKGLGGSNPPFSAILRTPKSLRLRGFSLSPLQIKPFQDSLIFAIPSKSVRLRHISPHSTLHW